MWEKYDHFMPFAAAAAPGEACVEVRTRLKFKFEIFRAILILSMPTSEFARNSSYT